GIRDYAGIEHDVFLTEDEALERFALSRTSAPANVDHQPLTELEKYFVEQIHSAKSQSEVNDVLKLIEALSDRFTPEQRNALLQTPRAFAYEA
ncbi:MAG: autoinducer synthase, partial [Pseudomonadota bacterium]